MMIIFWGWKIQVQLQNISLFLSFLGLMIGRSSSSAHKRSVPPHMPPQGLAGREFSATYRTLMNLGFVITTVNNPICYLQRKGCACACVVKLIKNLFLIINKRHRFDLLFRISLCARRALGTKGSTGYTSCTRTRITLPPYYWLKPPVRRLSGRGRLEPRESNSWPCPPLLPCSL